VNICRCQSGKRAGESVNRPQMDIKLKYTVFDAGKNIYFSIYPPTTLIHLSHRLPVLRNPQNKNLLSVVTTHFAPVGYYLRLFEFLDPAVNHFTQQTLPTVNMKRFYINVLCIESFCPQKNSQQNAAYVLYSNLSINFVYHEDFHGFYLCFGQVPE
jgi:hypothetical protein